MSIQEKLIGIQSELHAPKNQYNSFGKYKYRNLEDILEAVKPLLKKHGCTLVIADDIRVIGDRYYIEAIATLSDGENEIRNHAFARESETKKGMDDSQVTGATSSYARKYCLNGLFAIDDTKDADSQDNSQPAKKAPAKKKPAGKVDPMVVKQFESATSIQELGNVWTSVPQAKRSLYVEIKDLMKKKLTEAK